MSKKMDCEYQYNKFVSVVDKNMDQNWAISNEKYNLSKGMFFKSYNVLHKHEHRDADRTMLIRPICSA